jgi:hypothetical protein
MNREIHPDFFNLLKYKELGLIELYTNLRAYIFDIYPECNELLYHTHALTSVFSISEKLSNAFCMIPIYKSHLNLGFNKGTLLNDPHKLLKGTGKLIRHVPIISMEDLKNSNIAELIKKAVEFELENMEYPILKVGKTISKII